MPVVFPSSGSLEFSTIRDAFGDSNPVSLSEFYTGGNYMPSGQGVPTTGAISASQFRNIFARYQNINYYASSTTFTVPSGITRIFAIIVGGGGSGGMSAVTPANDPVQGPNYSGSGGSGGYGGLAIVYQTVTPLSVLTVTVGGYGGTSTFNGITATGGGSGSDAYFTGATSDIPSVLINGSPGGSGSSSGTNYISAPALGTNVTSAAWTSALDTLNPLFVGTSNASNRSSLTTVRNQTSVLTSGTTWSPSGIYRPGSGGPGGGTSRPSGTYGAIIVCY